MKKASGSRTGRAPSGVRRADVRFSVDAAFALVLLLLMLDRYTGNAAHEILGLAVAAALGVHLALNAQWLRKLPRSLTGSAARAALDGRIRLAAAAVVDAALFASFAASMVSGALISQTLFIDLIPFEWQGGLDMRTAHVQWSFWCFLLFGLHAGLHGEAIAGWLRKKLERLFASRPALRLSEESRAALGFVLMLWGLAAIEIWQMPAALAGLSSFIEWDEGDNAFLMTADFILSAFAWGWLAFHGKRIAKGLLKKMTSASSGKRRMADWMP